MPLLDFLRGAPPPRPNPAPSVDERVAALLAGLPAAFAEARRVLPPGPDGVPRALVVAWPLEGRSRSLPMALPADRAALARELARVRAAVADAVAVAVVVEGGAEADGAPVAGDAVVALVERAWVAHATAYTWPVVRGEGGARLAPPALHLVATSPFPLLDRGGTVGD